jgi:capsular exopolysaccharide synthesis family protein
MSAVASGGGNEELDLSRFLAALRRRKWTIVVVAVVMSASALLFSLLQTPVYEGEVRIALDPTGGTAVFDPVGIEARIDPDLVIQTEIELLKSEQVKAAVREELGPVRDVQASRLADTLLINVNGHSTDPSRAAAVTDTYARKYLELRRQQAAGELLAATDQVRASVAKLQSQIDALPAGGSPERREALLQQQARFSERLDQLEIEVALQSGGAHIVGEAELPTSPVTPTPGRDVGLALVLGAMLGVGLALLFEYRDDSVKTKEEMSGVMAPLPVVGAIPTVAAWRDAKLGRSGPRLVTGEDAGAVAASEAYRALRTSVRLLGVERPLTMIQITSALPGDGKSTTLANLAVVLVAAGHRVVMVDCDLRRPTLHSTFGLGKDVGFTSVLARESTLSNALQPIPSEGSLALLASGPLPPNPSELLGAKGTSELLFALRADFDMILVDCPPVLSVTDAAVLSVWVDATLLVAKAGVTKTNQLREALTLLRQAEAPVTGGVLNQVAFQQGYGDYYVDPQKEHRSGRRRERREPVRVPLDRGRKQESQPPRDGIGLFDQQRHG